MSTPHISQGSRSWASVSPREGIRRRYFPDVELTTHLGHRVRFYEDLVKDKIVTINFFYATCEGICVPITSNLVKVQALLGDRVGRDIFMYSFSLKPKEDTPEVLKGYAERFKTKPGWVFLTGNPPDLELVRRRLGFVDPDPVRDANKTNHTGMIRYGNEPLQLGAA
jgi:protein SCO1/2